MLCKIIIKYMVKSQKGQTMQKIHRSAKYIKKLAYMPLRMACTIIAAISCTATLAQDVYQPISSRQYQMNPNSKVAGDYRQAHQNYYQQKTGAQPYAVPSQQANPARYTQTSYGRLDQSYDEPATIDALALKAQSALIIDEDNNRVLYEKNPRQVRQIASITKLMTALVVLEANLPMDEVIAISRADLSDQNRSTRGVVKPGDRLTRYDALLFSLMYSENQAASALARYYPGGKASFIARMNQKAHEMGMMNTYFDDTVGMSVNNVSTAADLGRLVFYAAQHPVIRSFSTQPSYSTSTETRAIAGNNTNPFVRDPFKLPGLKITTQKTGYINKSGPCMVLQGKIQGRSVIMVFLGSNDRQVDVLKVHNWLTGRPLLDGIESVKGMAVGSSA
jgi:serine-type D-Ala-D-Ala endopeptidase (penicillin-binding protein 7)